MRPRSTSPPFSPPPAFVSSSGSAIRSPRRRSHRRSVTPPGAGRGSRWSTPSDQAPAGSRRRPADRRWRWSRERQIARSWIQLPLWYRLPGPQSWIQLGAWTVSWIPLPPGVGPPGTPLDPTWRGDSPKLDPTSTGTGTAWAFARVAVALGPTLAARIAAPDAITVTVVRHARASSRTPSKARPRWRSPSGIAGPPMAYRGRPRRWRPCTQTPHRPDGRRPWIALAKPAAPSWWPHHPAAPKP